MIGLPSTTWPPLRSLGEVHDDFGGVAIVGDDPHRDHAVVAGLEGERSPAVELGEQRGVDSERSARSSFSQASVTGKKAWDDPEDGPVVVVVEEPGLDTGLAEAGLAGRGVEESSPRTSTR